MANKNRKYTDKEMIDAYNKTNSVWGAAEILGCCGQSVHERLEKIGGIINTNRWTDKEVEYLKENYQEYADKEILDELADYFGREKSNVCRKAKSYGLTDMNRRMSERRAKETAERSKKWIKENGHPKGMKGKNHTMDARNSMSKSHIERLENMSDEEVSERVMKMLKTKEKNGTLYNNRQKTTWKQGWRKIGGEKKYYRSRWEANYARYLELLKNNGDIKKWEHEPKTFWFEKIKRGTRSYLPDFRVTKNDGSIEYHEVKGWMDQKSKTKLKRMAKYHPDVKMVLIRKKQYNEIKKKLGGAIKGWE